MPGQAVALDCLNSAASQLSTGLRQKKGRQTLCWLQWCSVLKHSQSRVSLHGAYVDGTNICCSVQMGKKKDELTLAACARSNWRVPLYEGDFCSLWCDHQWRWLFFCNENMHDLCVSKTDKWIICTSKLGFGVLNIRCKFAQVCTRFERMTKRVPILWSSDESCLLESLSVSKTHLILTPAQLVHF